MTLAVTQKPFITHLRHACLPPFLLQRRVSHPHFKVHSPLPSPSRLIAHLFFWAAYIISFIFSVHFFLLSLCQFAFWIKPVTSFSTITLPWFHSHKPCHCWDLCYSPTKSFYKNSRWLMWDSLRPTFQQSCPIDFNTLSGIYTRVHFEYLEACMP